MDRDDEQILRHSTRELAAGLMIFYEELRSAGLPRKVAEKLTVAQWTLLQANGQAEVLARTLLEGINSLEGEDT